MTEDLRTQLHFLRGSRVYCNIDLKESYTKILYMGINGSYVRFINGRYYRQTRLGMSIVNAEHFLQAVMSDSCWREGPGFDSRLRGADNL